LHDVLAREARVVGAGTHGAHDLGGDERGGAGLARSHPLAEHDLGLAPGVAGGPARVDGGGGAEGAPCLEVGVEDRLRRFLVRRPPEGVAAEAEGGYPEPGATKLAHEHGRVSFGVDYAGEPITIRSWSAERIWSTVAEVHSE